MVEPNSLKSVRPGTVRELQEMVEGVKGSFFSLILTQSRHAWNEIYSKGGSALTVKTQRFEGDSRIVIEVGWSFLQMKISHGTFQEEEDTQHLS